jgi:hypothetical protein
MKYDIKRISAAPIARRSAAIINDNKLLPIFRAFTKSRREKIARGNIFISDTDHSNAGVMKKLGRVNNVFMFSLGVSIILTLNRFPPRKNNLPRRRRSVICKKAIIYAKSSNNKSARFLIAVIRISITTSLTAYIYASIRRPYQNRRG